MLHTQKSQIALGLLGIFIGLLENGFMTIVGYYVDFFGSIMALTTRSQSGLQMKEENWNERKINRTGQR